MRLAELALRPQKRALTSFRLCYLKNIVFDDVLSHSLGRHRPLSTSANGIYLSKELESTSSRSVGRTGDHKFPMHPEKTSRAFVWVRFTAQDCGAQHRLRNSSL